MRHLVLTFHQKPCRSDLISAIFPFYFLQSNTMIRRFIIFLCTTLSLSAVAQHENTFADTTRVLGEVTIQAYQYDRPLSEIPASVAFLGQRDLARFSDASLLSSLNTVPGVRMEERSPGSYRLAIRGSAVRSPFGVRNVKVYWNDLPFTDAGGNTYLNLFDLQAVQQAEIIKGPGTSVYGAGTGGVLMLNNAPPVQSGVDISTLVGSYGLRRYDVQARVKSDKAYSRLLYAHQEADGYRQQTGMARDAVQLQSNFTLSDKSALSVYMLYSDLLYQTPGALTKQQYDEDPKQARPAGGPNPGAIDQHATIYNKTFYSGLSYQHQWNNRWSNRTGFYGTLTQFDNPTIRNYERRAEQGFGGRTSTAYNFVKGKLTFGGEFQHSFSPVRVYDNNQGQSGALQTDDEIAITTYFAFAQTEFFLPANFFLTLGGSINKLKVDFKRYSDVPNVTGDSDFDAVFSPRIALLKKLSDNLSLHGSFSQGYSPPTVQELYPSAGFFDTSLKPERGTNFEAGIRGAWFHKTLSVDAVVYNFGLRETIVIRHTDDGGEYFINAGKTSQQGAEVVIAWTPNLNPSSALSNIRAWTSLTWNRYTFEDYVKDNVSLDGNDLTGVSPNVRVAGFDIALRAGLYLNATGTYTDRIPLDDANTAYADSYMLIGGKLGYKKTWNQLTLDVFTGIDNALDERYSLGNDLNAVGSRYYNTAMPVNYYAGVKLGWSFL